MLDEQVKRIREVGGDVAQTHIRSGETAEEIVALAEEMGAGLVVMGSHGLGGIRRALIGGVSASVVPHAHCPVLIVREQRKGRRDEMSDPLISKILWATDGSKDAELAATTAVGLAKVTGSELHDVYVGHMPGVLYAAFSSVHHGAIHRGSSS